MRPIPTGQPVNLVLEITRGHYTHPVFAQRGNYSCHCLNIICGRTGLTTRLYICSKGPMQKAIGILLTFWVGVI